MAMKDKGRIGCEIPMSKHKPKIVNTGITLKILFSSFIH